MKSQKKYETYRDGKLKVRKRSKSSYQGKIYIEKINNNPRYVFKSIKTDDKNYAISELQNWCDDVQYLLRNKKELPISNQKNRFITYSKDYIDNFDRKDNATHKDDNKYHKHLMSWIKTQKIKQVDRRTLQSLLDDYLINITDSQNTKGHWFNYIRKVFRYQISKDVLRKEELPEFPKLKKNAGKRIYLDFSQYRKLIEHSIERMNESKLSRRNQLARKTLNRFIIFQCATGIRPDETYNLNWKDITTKRNTKGDKYLSIEVIDGKTGDRTVISKPSAVEALKELKMINMEYQDLFTTLKLDKNKVFPFKMSSSNRSLLKSANLYEDKSINKKRDIKTYRHTYISWGVIKGETLFEIAKNCGNSVAVIEKYYANNLTSKNFENTLSSFAK